ncbi:MAG: cyclic nucleotide-binding domain-containing protein [Candidatus Omnitrophica bacterium]|nr:cyclic nucleotide-binding domain-containing protein [Candidatus Omnitrophota bacterium]
MTTDKLERLKGVFLFKFLTEDELDNVASICKEKRFSAGDVIFSENETSNGMFLIDSGTVRITRKVKTETREVIALYSGDFFGEIALFDRVPRTASAVAVEECLLFEIIRDDFGALVSEHPRLGVKVLYKVIQDMSKRIRRMNIENDNLFI